MNKIEIDLDNLTIKDLYILRDILLSSNHLREANLIINYIKEWKEQYDRH